MAERNRRVVVEFTDLEDAGHWDLCLNTPEKYAEWFLHHIEGMRDIKVEFLSVEDTKVDRHVARDHSRRGG